MYGQLLHLIVLIRGGGVRLANVGFLSGFVVGRSGHDCHSVFAGKLVYVDATAYKDWELQEYCLSQRNTLKNN
jgi:hypothetical protein